MQEVLLTKEFTLATSTIAQSLVGFTGTHLNLLTVKPNITNGWCSSRWFKFWRGACNL